MKVGEMRTALIAAGLDEGELATMRRLELQQKYDSMKKEDTAFNMEFMDSEEDPVEKVCISDTLPKYGTKQWNDYVLSLMTEDELGDGCPNHTGLRRVAEDLLGEIVESGPSFISVVPMGDVRVVTVGYEIVFNWHLNTNFAAINLKDGGFFQVKKFGGVADCVEDLRSAYGRHPAAAAETKAASRALKRALALSTLTFEEKISGYDDPKAAQISSQMISMINVKAGTVNKNVDALIKELGYNKLLENLSMVQGRALFQHINTYQQS